MHDLQAAFGQIDIYLFDQILRRRIVPGMTILDAGCGYGRNLVYFFNEGYQVLGADADPLAIATVRHLAHELPAANFRVEAIECMSFPDACADVVLSSAVLHFARDDEQFHAMLQGAWRTLRPGGLFFCRLASSIGIEHQIQPSRTDHGAAGRRHLLPDGSVRYLVDEPLLLDLTAKLRATLLDPIKTTVVQNQRAMTTWVLRK
jgi:SAM-dependent methyltransferase